MLRKHIRPHAAEVRRRPTAIDRYTGEIRAWMDAPQNARRLRAQTSRWNQLNSCLETLAQTEQAMMAYARNTSIAGSGEHYLALYGLLQAMVLQQDAVCNLEEALGGSGAAVVGNRCLQEIRSIRNWSVGHPTKVDRRDVMSHHQIARPKLGRGFELVSAFDDGRRQYSFVSIADLIRRQKLAIARLLRALVSKLDDIHPKHTVQIRTKSEMIREHREARKSTRRMGTNTVVSLHEAKRSRTEHAGHSPRRHGVVQSAHAMQPTDGHGRQKGRERRGAHVTLPDHLERRAQGSAKLAKKDNSRLRQKQAVTAERLLGKAKIEAHRRTPAQAAAAASARRLTELPGERIASARKRKREETGAIRVVPPSRSGSQTVISA